MFPSLSLVIKYRGKTKEVFQVPSLCDSLVPHVRIMSTTKSVHNSLFFLFEVDRSHNLVDANSKCTFFAIYCHELLLENLFGQIFD